MQIGGSCRIIERVSRKHLPTTVQRAALSADIEARVLSVRELLLAGFANPNKFLLDVMTDASVTIDQRVRCAIALSNSLQSEAQASPQTGLTLIVGDYPCPQTKPQKAKPKQ